MGLGDGFTVTVRNRASSKASSGLGLIYHNPNLQYSSRNFQRLLFLSLFKRFIDWYWLGAGLGLELGLGKARFYM